MNWSTPLLRASGQPGSAKRRGAAFKVWILSGMIAGATMAWMGWLAPAVQAAQSARPKATVFTLPGQTQLENFAPFAASHAGGSPYPAPGKTGVVATDFAPQRISRNLSLLTLLALQVDSTIPTVRIVSVPSASLHQIGVSASARQFDGSLAQQGPGPPLATELIADPTLTDNWQQLFAADFAAGSLSAGCLPANSAIANPTKRTTWLVCGPFDARNADRFYVQFSYRPALLAAQDENFFFGVSADGRQFQGISTTAQMGDWITQRLLVTGGLSDRLWVAWAYTGKIAAPTADSVQLAGAEIWRYAAPAKQCGLLAAGDKGVVLSPYDPTAALPLPMIRNGDTMAAQQLQAAGVHWVRLGFQAQAQGLDLQAYDRMIDTLCAHDIRVLGLLNHETLLRQDYASDDEAVAAAYRAEFAGMAELLSGYFAGRIQDWEVWNEPNLADGAYLSPERYAHLLQRTQQGIKRANPNAQVVFGGLASAWGDSNEYLRTVYAAWDTTLHGVRPFDRLAIHPYPRKGEGPDPSVYMYADREPDYTTILDKFLQTMAEHGDDVKPIWITEVGWNSAVSSANRPTCFNAVLVQEMDQARYLKSMFDILFNEVTLWQQPNQRGVEKVFWYQYMDVGMIDPCHNSSAAAAVRARDWWFGLYRGDKITPKPGWCAFVAYPQSCLEIPPR